MSSSKRTTQRIVCLLAATVALAASPVHAAIVGQGNFSPAGFASWTPSTFAKIGSSSFGEVDVSAGDVLKSWNGDLGVNSGASGVVSIDGPGTTWNNSNDVTIGWSGSGQLNITNGGLVNVTGSTYFGMNPTGTGSINFGANGGTLTTGSLVASQSQITGTGTINAQGLVSDDNLTFDSPASLQKTLNWNGPGQSVTVNLNLTGNSGLGILGAGYSNSASVSITNGTTVTSGGAMLGFGTGSTGIADVSGTGSTWNANGNCIFGNFGNGTMNVSNGGQLTSTSLRLASGPGITGKLLVDGVGSKYSLNGNPSRDTCIVGSGGIGAISVTGGAQVNAIGFGCDVAGGAGSSGTITVDGAASSFTSKFNAMNIGRSGNGILNIRNGATFNLTAVSFGIGYYAGSVGTVNVDGIGSTLTLNTFASIGTQNGTGALNITNGAVVNVSQEIDFGFKTAGANSLGFGPNGGTLTTQSLMISPSQITGNGTINTQGLVSDFPLLFDSIHGLAQTFILTGNNQNVTLHMDMSVPSATSSSFGAGFENTGSLTIRDGVKINCGAGYLGYTDGSMGIALVSGPGSTWTCSGYLAVGNPIAFSGNQPVGNGMGILRIEKGAQGNCNTAYIGNGWNSSGTATLDGIGSAWNCQAFYLTHGALYIQNGGLVTATSATLSSGTLTSIVVGDNSLLTAGTNSITTKGTVLLKAAPSAAPGSYSPIIASSFSGNGTFKAVGGSWNSSTHTFSIFPAVPGNAGLPVTIDPSQNQRIVIAGPADLQAGFQSTAAPSSLTFTATLLSSDQSALLAAQLPADSTVLAGWNFTADGYTAGDPVYLSLGVASGYPADSLAVWHFDNSAWTPYSAPDLSYDGHFANFTVTGFSGYAVSSTPTPEPASLLLLCLPAILLLSRRRSASP